MKRKVIVGLILASLLAMTGCSKPAPAPETKRPVAQETKKPELVFTPYSVSDLGFAINYPYGAESGPDPKNPDTYSFHHPDFPMLAVVRHKPAFALPLDEQSADKLRLEMTAQYEKTGKLLEGKVTHVSGDIWMVDFRREQAVDGKNVRIYQRIVANRDYAWELHIPVNADQAADHAGDILKVLNSFSMVVGLK